MTFHSSLGITKDDSNDDWLLIICRNAYFQNFLSISQSLNLYTLKGQNSQIISIVAENVTTTLDIAFSPRCSRLALLCLFIFNLFSLLMLETY